MIKTILVPATGSDTDDAVFMSGLAVAGASDLLWPVGTPSLPPRRRSALICVNLRHEASRERQRERQRRALCPRTEAERLQQHSHAHLVREMSAHKVSAFPAQVAVYPGIEGIAGMAGGVNMLEDDEAVVARAHA